MSDELAFDRVVIPGPRRQASLPDPIGRVVNGYLILREIAPEEIAPGMVLFDNCPDVWGVDESPVEVLSTFTDNYGSLAFRGRLVETGRIVSGYTGPTPAAAAMYNSNSWLLAIKDASGSCMWCGEDFADVDALDAHEQVCGA